MTPRRQPAPSLHRSNGLSALVQQLQTDSRYTILDLGPALGSNLEFWSQYPCKLYLEDFTRSLPSDVLGEDEDNEQVHQPLLEILLPFSADLRFDIILCWDIFNYLTQVQLASFVRYLGKFCLQYFFSWGRWDYPPLQRGQFLSTVVFINL